MKIIQWNSLTEDEKKILMQRPSLKDAKELVEKTSAIIEQVKKEGDLALLRLTKRYDGVELDSLKVQTYEFETADKLVSPSIKKALQQAIKQIDVFHEAQYPKSIKVTTFKGIVCEKKPRPIAKVGLYVPGGTAPLLSTVLMLGVPAKIAGCFVRILCTPPKQDGTVDPHILYAAKLCGIADVYKIGGAQAIAAMAYGTESVPKVDKIFGPGNAFVTQAKVLVAQDPCGAAYDMPAGPSEVLVIADESADCRFVAADLLSQAEHDVNAQVILVTDDKKVAEAVNVELLKQLAVLPRKSIAIESLKNSYSIVVDSLDDAVAISNRYAPEHLIIQTINPRKVANKVMHAGSVFIGKWSPESVGDYASGTNHVLPTYGYAKCFSGLSVNDFMTQVTFQELSRQGLQKIAATVELLAEVEGLMAHKRAISIRLGGCK